MIPTGIVLIVLAVTAPLIAFLAAIFGFGGLAGDAFWASKLLSPLMLVAGIVLVAVGSNRKRSRTVG